MGSDSIEVIHGVRLLERRASVVRTGSVNFPDRIYENPPDFVESLAKVMLDNDIKPEVEVFDLAMLYNAANLVKKGLLKDKPHVQFVMGIPNAMPARRTVFDFLRSELPVVLPGATWVAAGVARFQWEVNQWLPRGRRPLPHRARGRPQDRRQPAGGKQRRAGKEDRRQLRALRAPTRDAGGSPRDPRPSAGLDRLHGCGQTARKHGGARSLVPAFSPGPDDLETQ
jgi:hypothetical protein